MCILQTVGAVLLAQSVCKSEANTRPCPRLVLVCCAALVTRGLETEGLFLEEAPLDLVQFLIGSFQEGDYTLHESVSHIRRHECAVFLIGSSCSCKLCPC